MIGRSHINWLPDSWFLGASITVLEHISNALIDGKSVKLSSFGTFIPRQKRERIGRNPKTGVSATIDARRVISFKASKLMKERINKSEKH